MPPLHATALALALVAAPLAAQSVQPGRLDLGILRTGATVEASFAVTWKAKDAGSRTTTVEPPKGVRAIRVKTVGNDDQAASTITLLVATDLALASTDAVVVRNGDERAELELVRTIEPALPDSPRVLVATTPFEASSTDDPTQFDAWRRLVAQARLHVDYRLSERGRPTFDAAALQRVDVVLVGCDAFWLMTDAEVACLQGFVCGGGRLVLATAHFYGGTVPVANRVAQPFGLQLLDAEPAPGGDMTATDDQLPRHPLTVGVAAIAAARGSPIEVLEPAQVTPLVQFARFGDRPFAAIATTRTGGELVVLGHGLWWTWIAEAPGNERLLRNLLTRAPRLR